MLPLAPEVAQAILTGIESASVGQIILGETKQLARMDREIKVAEPFALSKLCGLIKAMRTFAILQLLHCSLSYDVFSSMGILGHSSVRSTQRVLLSPIPWAQWPWRRRSLQGAPRVSFSEHASNRSSC
jgi:hypothetical protein